MSGENSEENQFESSAFHLQKLKEVNSGSKGLEEDGGARHGRGAHTEDLTELPLSDALGAFLLQQEWDWWPWSLCGTQLTPAWCMSMTECK